MTTDFDKHWNREDDADLAEQLAEARAMADERRADERRSRTVTAGDADQARGAGPIDPDADMDRVLAEVRRRHGEGQYFPPEHVPTWQNP